MPNQQDLPKILLLDVRSPLEFKADFISDSVNIPITKIIESKEELEGYDKIVEFCQTGNRSGAAVGLLKHIGINNVVNGGSIEQVKNKINSDFTI